MRRRTRGRGSGRGARGGGGSTSSRNNTTNSTPVIGPTKATTILTAFQRQSSPYIRQLRGGLGRTIKKAIDSIISDNDIMNNNTFPEGPRNGITDSFPQKVNGAHGNIINGESDGYLHKKFKKVTSAELPDKKNGTISIQRYNHMDSTLTLTLSKSEEDEPKPDPPQNPLRLEASDLQNGNGSDTQTSIPTVYKPKFRLATANDPSTASVPEAGVTLAQHLEKIQEDRNQRHLHDIPLAIVSTSPVRIQAESLSIEGHVNPIYNGHTSRHQSLPLALTISPGTFSSSGTSSSNSNGNSNSNFNGNSNGNSSSGDKRFDRKSLDDHISKIINENQSILATWPEHLSKRSKGNGGRYSLGARSTTNSFGFGFDEPSRRDSLDFVMSSNTEAAGSSFFKLSNGSSQKSIYNISRSNSDVGQHFPFQDQTDSGERREDNNKQADSSFTVPKKRRRLSPAPGILSGGEVAEMPNNGNGAIQGTIGTKQDQLAVPSVRNLCPQLQQQKEIDMTVRVSNCGNSGAKVTIRTSASGAEQLPGSRRSTLSHDESSNSSSTSSSRSHFSPDLRHNMIRIRKNSIFEMDTPAPSILPATSVPTTVAAPRKRGRPSKVHHEEAPKIRKVVERLQSHLNAKTAALAAQAQAIVPPSSSSKSEFDKSALLQVITQKSIKTSVNYNNQETIKVPEAFSATTTNKPSPISTIPNSSSLLLQTTALNPKRPTFLALKPTNGIIAKKRLDLSACILPSPETPRGAKNYNQMHINGNAYTYLGFKISTKSSYTCLFKPQPMFVPQETDPKLSMYSNWQPRPKDANEDAKLKLSAYDSRVNLRRSGEPLFMTSVGNHFDTLTINSPENSAPKFSLLDVCDTMANSGNSRTRTPLPVYPNAANSTKGHVDEPLVVPSLTLRRSRSPSPLPPPPAESPKLIIDERPYEDRIPRTSTPKPEISEAEDDVLTPLRKLSRPHEVQSGQNLQSDRPSQGPQRFRKKSIYFPPSSVPFTHDVTTSLSSSESSSADELTNLHLSRNDQPHSAKGRSVSLCIVPTKSDMSLDLSNTLSMGEKQRSQSVSLSSPSAILSNLDSARVKIMEGGFESNEDYTYIRGRGRGRYVCESCGIRCKKPSMLRKHLKTHTDLRPYTCKLCNFSFKTKGNLTKHQKSKSHHKKCIGLGIHPDSSRSLEMTGPISDSNDEGDSDDDDDDDDDENDTDSFDDQEDDSRSTSDNCNDKEKFEKEIALSLLDLSQMSRLPEKRDRNISESSSTSLPPNRKLSSFSSPGALQSTPRKDSVDFEAPIDLSIKTRACSLDSQPKFFGGIVKSMEIVGEAQRWEPEEDFMQTGYLNLKKIRNHVEQPKVEDKSPVPRGSPEENIQIEVSPSAIVPPLPPVEDKPFEFEITKRRRVVSMCSSPTAASLPSTSRTSSHSLSISSPLQMCSTPPPSSQATDSRTPPPNSASLPKRLHQPWLSPQGIGEAQQQNSQEPQPLNSKTLNGREDSPVEVASEKEEKMDLQEEIQTRISLPLTIQASSSGGNGIKIPSTSNGASNFQGFGGLLLGLKPQAEFRQPSGAQLLDDGKADCNVCGKTFARPGQLTLHMNIHYLERPFRCDPCGVSFRTKGHLLKHRRSSSHDCKVYLTEAWGVANEENPRPFKCADCKIAFRIHGHLAKHLRSKMHIMRMECLGKLPFGIYFEMEKTGLNLNEIDTTDCDMSLVSLQSVAQKIYGDEWRQKLSAPIEEPA